MVLIQPQAAYDDWCIGYTLVSAWQNSDIACGGSCHLYARISCWT